MRPATAANVRNAFGGECAAHVRYLIFSERAALEEFPNVARLFRALAAAERVHASGHYRQARELLGEYCVAFTAPFIDDRTVDNLTKSWEVERGESEELYPAFAAVARAQGELHVARDFERMAEVERRHATRVRKVVDYMRHAAEEPTVGDLYVCDTCGLVVEGEPPGSCTVCGAKGSGFRLVA